MKKDVYQKVTDKIIADLEQGELTWLKPWSAANMDGRIVKPLRHNGSNRPVGTAVDQAASA